MADNLSSYDLSSSYQLPTYQQQAARAQEIGKLLFIRTDTNTKGLAVNQFECCIS